MPRKVIIGIDEAGRGPLAGPVVVAAVSGIGNGLLKNIKDCKKCSVKKREEWYKFLKKRSLCHYASVNNKYIDKYGIQSAVRKAVRELLYRFPASPDLVMLDGSMSAPKRYKQRTIIKGDEKIPIISAASIIAKVTRDRKMKKLHYKYPIYNFYKHKGYGTKIHIRAIKKNGLCKIHRKTFCSNFS